MAFLTIFANNILPIFIVAGVGFLLARYWHVEVRTLSRLTLYGLVPCLVFDLLVTTPISAGEFGRLVVFTVCSVLGIGLIAWLVTLPFRLDRSTLSAFLIVVMFANGGNYGLPLTLFAFGQDALARATVYFVVSLVLTYTVGILIASSGQRSLGQSLAGLGKIPTLYALIAAAVVMATKTTLPVAVMRPVQLLGDAAIPSMLLVLGMQLERATRPERPLLVGLATALRLVVSTLLGLGLVAVLGISGSTRQAAVLQSAMPSAVVTTILALEFEIAPAFATGVVLLSTVISPFTLTLLIALLQEGITDCVSQHAAHNTQH